MSISERLQMVIKMNGMNNASFADEIGVQRSSISHVLAGRNKPSIDFIQKILTTFPKVNADWLITGKKIGRTIESDEEMTKIKRESAPVQSQSLFVKSEVAANEEGQAEYGMYRVKKEVSTPVNEEERRITKIVVFYSDGTFEETVPRN